MKKGMCDRWKIRSTEEKGEEGEEESRKGEMIKGERESRVKGRKNGKQRKEVVVEERERGERREWKAGED